jgi:hypothetical protein
MEPYAVRKIVKNALGETVSSHPKYIFPFVCYSTLCSFYAATHCIWCLYIYIYIYVCIHYSVTYPDTMFFASNYMTTKIHGFHKRMVWFWIAMSRCIPYSSKWGSTVFPKSKQFTASSMCLPSPNLSNHVRAPMNAKFPNKWIAWQPRSPDVTVWNFFLGIYQEHCLLRTMRDLNH